MVKARKYVVQKYFEGIPKRSDFKIVEYELPPLKEGEVLVKAEYISIDPYLRALNREYPVPFDQFSIQVGIIQESKDPEHPVGTRIVSHKGWCDYSIVRIAPPDKKSLIFAYKMPNIKSLPISTSLGAIGMPGVAAYFGFLEICKPKKGETVVVTGAAGAVGSIVGQIAKVKGCRVIGFAGSDEKVKWLEQELGFDKAYNYKTVSMDIALKESAPDGVDCYFDNVGGESSSTVMYHMNRYGRVSACGSISSYNSDPDQLPKVTLLQPAIVFRRLTVAGFSVWDWLDRWEEAFAPLISMASSGQIKIMEHTTEGFDKLFDAFVGMLEGKNIGKAIIKV